MIIIDHYFRRDYGGNYRRAKSVEVVSLIQFRAVMSTKPQRAETSPSNY